MTTMCDLASKLPLLVGRLLDREAKLERGRFREETMTDIFTGALAAFAGPDLVIAYPPEADTGADIDLRFWHVETDSNLFVRIQAKRLSAATNSKKAVKVAHRSYHELLHMPPTASEYQYETLAKAPSPWIPLYMFYNHQSVTQDPLFRRPGPSVQGINLAFAADVAKELTEKVTAAKGKPKSIKHHKRLSHLRKHLFGLDAILCPPGDWDRAGVPSPKAVSESLRERWGARGLGTARTSDEEVMLRLLSEPREMLPDRYHGRLPDGPSVRFEASLERPTVTFISGRTTDDRTPTITEETDNERR